MNEPGKVSPREARKKVFAGLAHLVCAYDEHEKFLEMRLEGAVSLQEYASYLTFISKRQEVIFYCDSPDGAKAADRARQLQADGYKNAKVLDGGVEGWKAAGLAFAKNVAEETEGE